MDAHFPKSRPKDFVVDDDDAVRDSIKLLLDVDGIDVEDYESTEVFARHYRRPCRGVVILDQHLPVMTGVDFLNSPAGSRLGLPVILMTGRGDPELERRARAAGAADFLQKPVSGCLLLATIERVTADQVCQAR
jgi:two-component system response regulator FixJ